MRRKDMTLRSEDASGVCKSPFTLLRCEAEQGDMRSIACTWYVGHRKGCSFRCSPMRAAGEAGFMENISIDSRAYRDLDRLEHGQKSGHEILKSANHRLRHCGLRSGLGFGVPFKAAKTGDGRGGGRARAFAPSFEGRSSRKARCLVLLGSSLRPLFQPGTGGRARYPERSSRRHSRLVS